MHTCIEQALTRIEGDAKATNWMYLDARGKVKVGAGLLLAEPDAAEHLPFQVGTRAASAPEIAAEFQRVRSLPPNLPREFYRRENGLELEPEVMDALVRTSLVGLQGLLRASLPGFDTLGQGTQVELLDLGYSAGVAEALSQYPGMMQRKPAEPAFEESKHRNEPTHPTSPGNQTATAPGLTVRRLKNLGFGLVGLGATLLEWLNVA